MKFYTLDERGEPVPERDVLRWAEWFENANRGIAREPVGEACVSTVFLGLDHNLTGGPPVLWETMIFGGPHHGWCVRYTSRAEAIAGHERAVFMLQELLTPAQDVAP